MEARINALRDKLSRPCLMDTAQLPKDRGGLRLGPWSVKDLDLGDLEEFTLVGMGEEDPDSGKILATCPLAQGLVGKKVGERVEIRVPRGVERFEIVEIRSME